MKPEVAICACQDHAWFPIGKGFVVLIDPADVQVVSRWHWCPIQVRTKVYARRSGYKLINGEEVRWVVKLHQQLVCVPGDWHIDHVNGNGLDNRSSNLRPCTPTQTTINARRAKAKSGFRGVYSDKRSRSFKARIIVKQSLIHLGNFPSADDAARAYDAAAIQHFGEFAVLNFPQE